MIYGTFMPAKKSGTGKHENNQAPISNNQIITKHQYPITKGLDIDYWLLGFIWLLYLGYWL
ncbi:MAG: hypothetical protein AABZ27_04600, partial [Candidatus Omnitrophota bacterium]